MTALRQMLAAIRKASVEFTNGKKPGGEDGDTQVTQPNSAGPKYSLSC
jgi:hypothetical protein